MHATRYSAAWDKKKPPSDESGVADPEAKPKEGQVASVPCHTGDSCQTGIDAEADDEYDGGLELGRHKDKKPTLPKIFYATRTHSQIAQVLGSVLAQTHDAPF